MQLWIGTMVGSRLNSSAAAQLLPLTSIGDVDGALLVGDESQANMRGGFLWNHGDIVLIGPGHGVFLRENANL